MKRDRRGADRRGVYTEKIGPGTDKLQPEDDNACRCKDVSRLSMRGLFDLMIKDLSFWRRRKG